MKKENIVTYKIHSKGPQTLTAAQKKRSKGLADMPDSAIDYSDDPDAARGARWTRPGALVPQQNKHQITLRLDADVVQFFKATGKRYQGRINAALREYISRAA